VLRIRRKPNLHRFFPALSIALAAVLAAGCAVSRKTVVKPSQRPAPRQTATKQDLIARYSRQAEAITSLNAAVTMKLTAGSAYTGVIEQYHEVNGFILAQRPASIRVIGQAPVVGTNIFDMVSDGQTFHIFIPSRGKFIEGPTTLERPSAKPIENLRPQHLTDAIFWTVIPSRVPVLFEEAEDGMSAYYVLTVVRLPDQAGTEAAASADWEISTKIWYNRADLNVARLQTYDPGGKIASDVRYSGWDTFGTAVYPRQISLSRPGNDYELQIGITRLTLNEPVSADRFVLQQPPGTELVRVGEEPGEKNP
jgi:outer membrane lipoprotein-sorting protein